MFRRSPWRSRQDERVGEGLQKVVVGDRAGVTQDRFGAAARYRDRQPVDGLAGGGMAELPIGCRAQVRYGVADTGTQLPGGGAPHEVQVDDDGDRYVSAVGDGVPVTFQRRHGRGYAVVGETGRHGDHGKSLLKRRVLDRVDEAAAADADDGVEIPGLEFVGQGEGVGVTSRGGG